MREWCSCGAGIRSLSVSQIRQWRAAHRCPDRPAEPEPDKDGAYSSTERRGEYDFGGHPIGFTLNVGTANGGYHAEPGLFRS